MIASGTAIAESPPTGPNMVSVALVCMPWHVLRSPSIQIATLHALLARHGTPCTSHSLHLEFARFLAHGTKSRWARLSLAQYFDVGERWYMSGAGEWVFAQPEVRPPDPDEDERFLAGLRRSGMTHAMTRQLRALRAEVPAFLAACADEILATGPQLVGFTTTFGQTVASLALASVLKRRRPDVATVFGGAGCDGSMGAALHRSFPCIDFVVRGEAEPVLPGLAAQVLAGAPVPDLPGLCRRQDGREVAVTEQNGPGVAMVDVPVPDYAEYFARLQRLRLDREIVPVLPFEAARGCWWGARSHCTFCGLNGQTMTYRSKPAARVVAELATLSQRHGVLDFTVVDNILEPAYFDSVLPTLRDGGTDLRLFWQTKANLGIAQIRLLRDAGIRCIRPGIESLSTPILRLMKKGVSALQNVRLLKWCAQYGIHVAWNVIHGLPDEPVAEYARMAALVPRLVHLPPPALVPLTLDRYSPYHQDPRRHHLRVVGPPPHYRALYGLDDRTLTELAWTFEYELASPAPPAGYVDALRQQVTRWREEWHQNQGALTYRRGPACLVVVDRRTTVGQSRFVLDEFETGVYLGCDAGITAAALAAQLARRCKRAIEIEDVRRILRQFADEQLVFEDGDHYLSLALPEDCLVAAGRLGERPSLATRP